MLYCLKGKESKAKDSVEVVVAEYWSAKIFPPQKIFPLRAAIEDTKGVSSRCITMRNTLHMYIKLVQNGKSFSFALQYSKCMAWSLLRNPSVFSSLVSPKLE